MLTFDELYLPPIYFVRSFNFIMHKPVMIRYKDFLPISALFRNIPQERFYLRINVLYVIRRWRRNRLKLPN